MTINRRETTARPLIAAIVMIALLAGAASGEPTKARSGHFRTSDNVRLHYLESGKGPSIIFVPGWTVPAWMWEPQIQHFAKTHHVVALDPRSQGESAQTTEGHHPERRAKDIKELVEKHGLAPAVLVGHSLAVTELLSYVEQFGTGTVAGLVLVDQGFGPYPTSEEVPKFFEFVRLVSFDRRRLLDQMARTFYKNPPPRGYLERLVDDAMKTPTNSALAMLVGRCGMDFHSTLSRLDVPVLYAITPTFAKEGEWLKATLPRARVEVFEKAGHVLFVDEAERFNSLLGEFARAAFDAKSAAPAR